MTVIKTWEAVDVKTNKEITIFVDEQNNLHASRNYQYVDINGDVVMKRLLKFHQEIRPWGEVPQNIKDALITIDNYINSAIDEKEGIVRD